MNKQLLIITAFFLCLNNYSQTICYEDFNGEYWPFNIKERKFFISNGSFTLKYSKDSLKMNNKFYFKRIKEYNDGKIEKDFLEKLMVLFILIIVIQMWSQ